MGGVRNLETKDVKGAQADTKRLGSFTHYPRRADQVRPVGSNDDVDGSKCGSVLKGIVTTRQSNPLMPNYQMPGQSVDGSGAEINNPYGNQGKRRDAAVNKSVNFKGSNKLAENGLAQMNSHSASTAQKLDKFIS